jgi:Spy/CpxP family protein refolding chaperone
VAQAIAEVAEILTLEQRLKINDHLERRERWRGWHRG